MSKVFHWLTALMIFTVIPVGVIADRLALDAPLKVPLFSAHKTLGVLIFIVAVCRILWALTQKKPGDLHLERRVETLIAHLVHWMLYIALVLVPLSGWLHHAATTGFAPIWLPIGQDLPFIPKDESLAEVFAGLHWIWGKILVFSILLHIAGTLKHQIIDKDVTLSRMWFGNVALPDTSAPDPQRAVPFIAVAIYLLGTGGAAMSGLMSHKSHDNDAPLAQVASEWVVTQGTLGIGITQLGNPVQGQFDDWTAAIQFDENATGTLGTVTTTIAIGSLNLGSVGGQAMGADFFDADVFPTATFDADITADGPAYLATGTLTIKDISVPVSLPFVLNLQGDTAEVAGSLALDRRDFAIGQSMADESNLGFDVAVTIMFTATR
ncbi:MULTISPECIES: cytochrome b/b6 domain-containing protein [Rhodobacterales]|uniref:cytochrome b/b6 domain-containing protein n=1 Tax=Rhodobacterales TaxID=204455 RepID=UPI002852EAC3|nr:cytochrome b/b6 domain-containing protein [Loktanella sp. D2R18]